MQFSVMINRTRTIEESVEITVSAKDEGTATEKAEAKIDKAITNGTVDADFDWQESSSDDQYEYEPSEA